MGKKRRAAVLALTLALLLTAARRGGRREVPAEGPADIQAEGPLVALSFDDGPRRSTTEKLLDGLARRGVKATFFLVGKKLSGCEDLVERMEEEGHQIGTHSYDHVKLTGLSAADFACQADRTEEALAGILGRSGFALRPPYGEIDNGVARRAHSPLVLWSVDPEDWRDRNVDRVVSHIVSRARDGDIILLHDIYPATVEAALRAVDALHGRGFLFVTVEELARQRHVELKAGETYRHFY